MRMRNCTLIRCGTCISPRERNYLKAHLTLFHKLPGEMLPDIQSTVKTFNKQFPITAKAGFVYSLGGGVAIAVEAPELLHVRQTLAKIWIDWLTPQDRQGFKPHVTIQNKVTAEKAHSLLAMMKTTFAPFDFEMTGLDLWHYADGPWDAI